MNQGNLSAMGYKPQKGALRRLFALRFPEIPLEGENPLSAPPVASQVTYPSTTAILACPHLLSVCQGIERSRNGKH